MLVSMLTLYQIFDIHNFRDGFSFFISTVAGREPLPEPEMGCYLTLGNELSEETHVLTKQEILLGKGAWVESSRVREPRTTALVAAQFYGDRISFPVVFSQLSDSESFLVMHTLFSQDGCQREGFWEVVRHVSPFDLC